jgi:hypothetical protein
MRIGLRNPAEIGPSLATWGDYHFGCSLAAALGRAGVAVEQRFWPEWDQLGAVDACLTLRGKRARPPRPGVLNAIWIISHPAEVSPQELAAYDIVFTASETHRRMLGALGRPVHVLRQCTDTTLFATAGAAEDEIRARREVLFVGNSRGVRRPGIAALLAAGVPVAIVGRHWPAVGLAQHVREPYVDNRLLPALYRSCRLALNDHWCDMKYFGIINNRIFDCLATGTPVITDRFPELEALCGDGVLYWEDTQALAEAIAVYRSDYRGLIERTRRLWERIGSEHSFARRAEDFRPAIVGAPAAAGAAPGAASALDPAIEAELRALRGADGGRRIHLLHLEPPADLRHALAARDDLDYVTAGRGVGPWLVDIADGFSALQPGKFQAIVADRRLPLDPAALRPLLAAGGRLVLLGGGGTAGR